MTSPEKLIGQLKDEFEHNSQVKAFVLVGSQAREDIYKATKYSDMEAYVITEDEYAEELESKLPDLLKKSGNILFSFRHAIGFVAIFEDLFRLELPVIKISGMPGLFTRPKDQLVKVLIDRTDGKLGEILDKRPETIDFEKEFKEKTTNFWFWQILGTQYFKKGEYYNTRAVLGIHAGTMIWLYELLNNPKLLLLETNKRIEQFLTPDQLASLKKITPAYEKDDIYTSLKSVVSLLPNIFEEIKNKYGYEYDRDIGLQVQTKLEELLKE